VYCFDTWVGFVREKGISKICLQYHDEICYFISKTIFERVKEALQLSITQTNEKLQLNVPGNIQT
jgi:hypothetical protein